VLQFETETDLVGLGFLASRQRDTDRIVTWEVAGTAHADDSLLEYGRRSAGTSFDLGSICGAINTGPQAEVLRAAFAALAGWVADGTAPPRAPRIKSTGSELRRDEQGVVLGGVRTPAVEAPTATLTGESEADSIICSLFGTTKPFAPEQLAQLYPTHADYVEAVTESANAAVKAGFLLRADRDALIAEAKAASVPG
jgi:Alpha/beta hydrolase domain